MTDFFDDLERELRRRTVATARAMRARVSLTCGGGWRSCPRPACQLLVALAVLVALVAVVVTVARESDVERSAAPPGKKVVGLPTSSAACASASTTGTDGAAASTCAQPDLRNGQRRADQRDLRRERRRAGGWARDHAHPAWPAGQTSLSYRFPRDVSSWCRLYDQSGSNVASVSFLGASPGPTGPIAETAAKWARLFASSSETCADYMSRTACKQLKGSTPEWRAYFRGATVQAIAISGDRAAATFSNDEIVQLRRRATGEWLIDTMGSIGAVGPDAAAQRRQRVGV